MKSPGALQASPKYLESPSAVKSSYAGTVFAQDRGNAQTVDHVILNVTHDIPDCATPCCACCVWI